MASDPLDELFELENKFYKEGYDLGVQDGTCAGQIEGRLFGLEKGFKKYAAMGRLHGRSVIWSGRLQTPSSSSSQASPGQNDMHHDRDPSHERNIVAEESTSDHLASLPQIPHNLRLEKHARTLYALTEPASLSTENTEDAVSDFDDRLKRAEGKVKIIEKLVGEDPLSDSQSIVAGSPEPNLRNGKQGPANGDGGIEDMSVPRAKR
ncbi:MAG: hypothetical protein LQ338_006946 [Usnochroma carphineum]|nr:MAG: hypothetical protein LQ338_006946 [Usnochroma carphineum]